MPKVYKRDSRTRYIISSKLTLKTPDADLVSCKLWTWFTCYYNVYIANFEQVPLCQKPMFQHYTGAERHNRFTVFIVDFKHISHLVLVFLLIFHIPVIFRLIWILVWTPCPMVSLNNPVHYAFGNLLYKYFNLIIYTKITCCHFY